MKERAIHQRTIYEYTHDLHQLLSKYPNPSPQDFEKWIGELAKDGLKLSSLQRKFASIRAWARWRKLVGARKAARRDGQININSR